MLLAVLNPCVVLMPEGYLQEVEDILDTVWNVVKDSHIGAAGHSEQSLVLRLNPPGIAGH